MLIREFMWEIFQSTGHIEAYLMYCSCKEEDIPYLQQIAKRE